MNIYIWDCGCCDCGYEFEVFESLRVNFKHPIVAKKTQPSGYYLPRNEDERQAGLAPYRRQILTEQKNLATVMGVDLNKYWSA